MKNIIIQELEKRLSKKRIKHSLSVSEIALEIAKHHQLNEKDEKKIEQAALLHDIAKDMSLEEIQEFVKKIKIDPEEVFCCPILLHGKIGKLIGQYELGITDDAILSAIENHTTGKPHMGIIELCVYVADYLDPSRKLKNHSLILKIAKKNIYQAALLVAVSKIQYVLETFRPLEKISIDFYHWLLEKRG